MPPNDGLFSITHFLYGWQKIFTNQKSSSKQDRHVLLISFYSKIDNKKLIFLAGLNIKDIEFDFRMGCIPVFFPLFMNIKHTIYKFFIYDFLFLVFQNYPMHLILTQNNHNYHWNFSKTKLKYKIWMNDPISQRFDLKSQQNHFLLFLPSQKFIIHTNIQIHAKGSIFIAKTIVLNAPNNVLDKTQ